MADRTFALPKELSSHSPARALVGVVFALTCFFGSWFSVAAIFDSELTLPLKLVLGFLACVFGGYGMLMLGFMGHDGTHFTLHSNKIVSSLFGILLTAPVCPYLLMGFTISHWNHHKYTNTDQDPDSRLFSRFKNLFTRSFIARPFTFYEYGANTFRLALGIPLPFTYQFPLKAQELKWLARVNILSTGIWAAIYGWVAVTRPDLFAALLAVYVFGTVISGLSPYIEHTGTGYGRGNDTRTSDGWWLDLFTLGNNYHIEHHLYPTVPFYRLKAVHRHLKAQGFYSSQKFVSSGFWDTYRYALRRYAYPLVKTSS